MDQIFPNGCNTSVDVMKYITPLISQTSKTSAKYNIDDLSLKIEFV